MHDAYGCEADTRMRSIVLRVLKAVTGIKICKARNARVITR